MGKDSELNRLEQQIERLLQGYATVREEKQRLEQALREAADENVSLREQITALTEERGDIKGRVGSLIDRIERWQAELAESAESEYSAASPASATGEEAGWSGEQQADRQSPESSTRKQEREGGLQGSLFPA